MLQSKLPSRMLLIGQHPPSLPPYRAPRATYAALSSPVRQPGNTSTGLTNSVRLAEDSGGSQNPLEAPMNLVQEFTYTATLKPPLPIGAGPIGTRMYYDVTGGPISAHSPPPSSVPRSRSPMISPPVTS